MLFTCLPSQQSSWHSNPGVYFWNQFWRTSRWGCLNFWSCLAGRSHRPYPTKWSHPHPWSSGGHCSCECGILWTVKVLQILPPLVSSTWFQGWTDNCPDGLARWQHLCERFEGWTEVKDQLEIVSETTTHPLCTLQGKHFSIARVQTQWLSQRHSKRRRLHNSHSSIHHYDIGTPGLQGQNRVGQEWAWEGKGRRILDMRTLHILELIKYVFCQILVGTS